MTVRELKELLATMPDDLVVLEERESELRVLRKEDVTAETYGVTTTDDGEEITGGVIIFGAWS